MYIMMSFF